MKCKECIYHKKEYICSPTCLEDIRIKPCWDGEMEWIRLNAYGAVDFVKKIKNKGDKNE